MVSNDFMGIDGFRWFIGVVEDRDDPEKASRVRVRCFGYHDDDLNKIPIDSHNPLASGVTFAFFITSDSLSYLGGSTKSMNVPLVCLGA